MTRKHSRLERLRRGALVAGTLIALVPLVLTGCSKKEKSNPIVGPQPPPSPSSNAVVAADSGWAHFQTADYQGALTLFNQALGYQSDWTNAFSGRGWCRLRLDSLPAAEAGFDSALVHADYWQDDLAKTDALLGKAITSSARGDYASAAAAGSEAASLGGDLYTFRGDSHITADYPRLLAAEAYVRLGQYQQAYDMLVAIDVTVSTRVDPNSRLFVELLLAEIQRISMSLGY